VETRHTWLLLVALVVCLLLALGFRVSASDGAAALAACLVAAEIWKRRKQ